MKLEHLAGVNNEIFLSFLSTGCKSARRKSENKENPLISVDLFTFCFYNEKKNDDEKN
jgi:hypothetical protein